MIIPLALLLAMIAWTAALVAAARPHRSPGMVHSLPALAASCLGAAAALTASAFRFAYLDGRLRGRSAVPREEFDQALQAISALSTAQMVAGAGTVVCLLAAVAHARLGQRLQLAGWLALGIASGQTAVALGAHGGYQAWIHPPEGATGRANQLLAHLDALDQSVPVVAVALAAWLLCISAASRRRSR